MNRTFVAHNPLGPVLQFRSLFGTEKISRLFEFRVKLISPDATISAKDLLGKDMSIEIDLTSATLGAGQRYLSGQITEFTYAGREGDFFSYEAVLRPWLWHASRRSDFKIFQFKKVPQIIKEVLDEYGFVIEDRLTGSYREWDYVVQYGETDLKFVSRLMEEEGVYYYFEHSLGAHKLVLADDIGSHQSLPDGRDNISFYSSEQIVNVLDQDYVDGWRFAENIASGKYAAKDYDFKKPKAILDARQQHGAGHVEDHREIYDWPGGYTDLDDGENYARVRFEQQSSEREVARGEGVLRTIAPGYLFSLEKYPRADQNQEYLIESARYQFEENVRRSDGGIGDGKAAREGIDTATTYHIGFDVVPKSIPYRSQRVTPKPQTTGPQTAIVTGPVGEEIYTDEYGRVKVQFHWDRYGKFDENSSVWIRVSQAWAGANYGTMHVPRIGQEVIVDFLNGDPDYPIITGRVYNALQMPPWDLPANKTQSGIKTHSTLGGAPGSGMAAGAGDCNALRFDDKKGAEQLWMHAQKDQLIEVENNEAKWVGNSRLKAVGVSETTTIGVARTEIVGVMNSETIGTGDVQSVGVFKMTNVGVAEARNDGVLYANNVGVMKMTNVGMLRSDQVGMDWMRLIGRNRSADIGNMNTKTVGKGDVQDVGVLKMTNVGVAEMRNDGVLYAQNVGVMKMSNVGMLRMDQVGMDWMKLIGRNLTTLTGGDSGTIASGSFSVKAGAAVVIEASATIALNCGASSILLTPAGIIINAPFVMIN